MFSCFCTSQITSAAERFVSPVGAHQPPFTSWADAATNIQDAIDVASSSDVVWVTNGVYSASGKIMSGDLLNRVALDKALTVRSVNGPDATIIQGVWDPNTNGPLAVRCAWLTNGAVLNGFTLQGGATRTNGDATLQNGGGVWGVSTQAVVMNCWIYTNAAAGDGGGSFQAALDRCKVVGNQAVQGGGAANGSVQNSFISKNTATTYGGGSFECNLNHCTVTENWSQPLGGAVRAYSSTVRNSILGGNLPWTPGASAEYAGLLSNISYCCVGFIPAFPGPKFGGVGNITSYPEFTDAFHLSVTSPCRGKGSGISSDTDIDGEAWSVPPSIGCDEVIEANLKGPLSVTANTFFEAVERQQTALMGEVAGRTTRMELRRWSVTNES